MRARSTWPLASLILLASCRYRFENQTVATDDGPFVVTMGTSGNVVDLLSNDSPVDGKHLRVVEISFGDQGGVLEQVADTPEFRYTPQADFYGVEYFRYAVASGAGEPREALVRMHVMTPFTWSGLGDWPRWALQRNWCGEVLNGSCQGGPAPQAENMAVFDATCLKNCDANIETSVALLGIEMGEAYAGTVRQELSASITLGARGWQIHGGSFLGGDRPIVSAGPLIIDQGLFQSTSASLTLGQPSCEEVTTFRVGPRAEFRHNQGTLTSVSSRLPGQSCSATVRFETEEGLALYSLVFQSARTAGGHHTRLEAPNGNVILVEGDYSHHGDTNHIALDVHGNIEVAANTSIGEGVVRLIGIADQVYSGSQGLFGLLVIDKPSGVVLPDLATHTMFVQGLDIRSGVFHAPPDSLFVGYGDCISRPAFSLAAEGAMVVNSAAITIRGGRTPGASCSATATIDIPAGFKFSHLSLVAEPASGGHHSSFAGRTGLPLQVNGNYYHGGARQALDVMVTGNYLIGTDADQGGGSVTLNGAGPQTVTMQTGGLAAAGELAIEKISGEVTLLSDLILSGTGQGLRISAGGLNLNGFDLAVPGTLTLALGTTLLQNGGALSYGSLVSDGSVLP